MLAFDRRSQRSWNKMVVVHVESGVEEVEKGVGIK
jgi:hypothetical protein